MKMNFQRLKMTSRKLPEEDNKLQMSSQRLLEPANEAQEVNMLKNIEGFSMIYRVSKGALGISNPLSVIRAWPA